MADRAGPPQDPGDAENEEWLQDDYASDVLDDDVAEWATHRQERLGRLEDWRALARAAILGLLDLHDAVVPAEIVARAGDYPWKGDQRIDQHHLLSALATLLNEGELASTRDRARGGREVVVIHRAAYGGRKREIERAAGRRRLLDARYLGWASGTDKQEGVIGPAAEDIVHRSLLRAAPRKGLLIVNDATGSASEILGARVHRGPLDNAAVYNPIGAERPFVLAIEVKSLRPWIYPRHDKLYQLLFKAAMLSRELPDIDIVPVLVCRKAHLTTFRMAKELGFHVIDTQLVQWLPSDLAHITPEGVQEVREGLGFVDLRFSTDDSPYLIKQLGTVVPDNAAPTARRWRAVGSTFVDAYEWLWDHRSPDDVDERRSRVNELRNSVRELVRALPADEQHNRRGGW